jgi:hypothetical protein
MIRPLGYLTGAAIALGLLSSAPQAKPKFITFQVQAVGTVGLNGQDIGFIWTP